MEGASREKKVDSPLWVQRYIYVALLFLQAGFKATLQGH